MENFRSKSTREGRLQMESYYGGGGNASGGPQSMKDLRSYSTSYAYTSSSMEPAPQYNKEVRIKKSKSRVSSSFASKSWSFNDPELQRKKRVVGYKAYAVEGKMKGSLRKSFRWIKNTCSHVVYVELSRIMKISITQKPKTRSHHITIQITDESATVM